MTIEEYFKNHTTEDLENEFRSLYWMNYVYGQVSMSELRRIDAIATELTERRGWTEEGEWTEFNKWADERHAELESDLKTKEK